MIRTLVAAILLLAPVSAFAQRIVGQDTLAGEQSNFDTSTAAKYYPQGTPLGGLHYTFGDHIAAVRGLLASVAPRYYRVHLLNTTCVNNQNCGRYEPVYGYTAATLIAAIKRHDPKLLSFYRGAVATYCGLGKEFPATTFLYSPALEHPLDTASWRILADITLEVCPGAQLVNCPRSGVGEKYRGAWLENHGDTPRVEADISSLDGADAEDIDSQSWLKRTLNEKITFVWSRSYNCRNQGPWEDPRVRKSCPDGRRVEELYHLGDFMPPAPAFQGTQCNKSNTKPFVAPDIWKPLPEDKGVVDVRVGKPVLITSLKGSVAGVLDSRGSLVGTLGYYGKFTGNQVRYYSGWKGGSSFTGYEFQKRAYAKTGSPWVWIQIGNRCEGPITPGRRNGVYR